MKKVVIFGEGAVGKTSIVLTSFFGHKFEDIEKLAPTKGISIEKIDFRGMERLNIWDCGGQEKYMQAHFSEVGKKRIFSEIDIAIFVMDASREETLDPLYADRFLKLLMEYNPELSKVYIFINKMDIAPKNIADLQMRLTKNLLDRWGDGKFVQLVNCSVKFGSAKERILHILDSVLTSDPEFTERKEFFAGCLADFRDVVNADFFLFHIPSKLSISDLISESNIQYLPYIYEFVDTITQRNGTKTKIFNKANKSLVYLKVSEKVGMIIMLEETDDVMVNKIVESMRSHNTFKDLTKIFSHH